jgi:hypothetical protein
MMPFIESSQHQEQLPGRPDTAETPDFRAALRRGAFRLKEGISL